ncbi:uncharacterized protein LOC143038820 [Oratosquilla oratoria]|uniref:uncharacterized protein LOC143038820 n=1 Tax=Oratosquilla oratoria TaxID=337810 RepID=UPI003F7707F3
MASELDTPLAEMDTQATCQTGGGKLLPIVTKEEYTFLTTSNIHTSIDPRNCTHIPPENDLHDILKTMEENEKFTFVKFSFGVFSANDIKTFISIYVKKQENKAAEERDWFENLHKSLPGGDQLQKPIEIDKIYKFYMQSNRSIDDAATIPLPGNMNLLYKDVMSLTCNRWMTISVLLRSIELLISCQNEYYVGYLGDVNDFAHFGARVRQQHGSFFRKFVFAMNVHKVGQEPEITSIDSADGCHFSFCLLTLDGQNASVLYVDTFRYAVPKSLKDYLPRFLLGYLENYDVKEWNFQTVGNTYPIQSCSSICGPATVIGMAMAVKESQVFEVMTSHASNRDESHLSFLNHLLPDLSTSSVYLRCIILNWLMDGEMDIQNLFLKDLVNDGRHLPFNINAPQYICQTTLKSSDNETVVTALDTSETTRKRPLIVPSEVSAFIDKTPEVVLSKKHSLQLRCTLKNSHKLLTKNFTCSDFGLKDNVAIKKINEFLKSEDCISWLQSKAESFKFVDISACNSLNDLFDKKPKIRFCAPHYLHVTCYLKGGFSISKKVKCNDLRKDDLEAMKKIEEFLKSPDTLEMAKNKINGTSTKKVSGEWISDGSVDVGLPTKHFFDSFKFDVLKKVNVLLDCVESVYLGNQSTLNVSVTSNKNWGKTHRYDETYKFVKEPPPTNVTAVTMLISCASKSPVCRANCGVYLSDPSCRLKDGKCEACGAAVEVSNRRCDLCLETDSPYWRFENNQHMCNTCYVYFKKHGLPRPLQLHLKSSVKSRRQKTYIKHFQCSWKMKLILYSSDLNTWKIFQHRDNAKFHQETAEQVNRRPNLSTRDLWDFQRVTQKSTAKQIHLNDKITLHFAKANEEDKPYQSMKKIVHRIRTVDKNNVQSAIKIGDDIPLPGSDWRNTEKVLESHTDHVLLFQRGDDSKGRSYHIVLSNGELCKMLKIYGKDYVGYDTKDDFVSVRFSTGLVSFSDAENKGRAAAIGISNSDSEQSHCLNLQILFANIPCSNIQCSHPQDLYIFNDFNGYFFIRPCAFHEPISPTVQHGKNTSIKSALVSMGLKSALCSFHSLNAFQKHLTENPTLRLFYRPLETCFKCVMHSWNLQSRRKMTSLFEIFVNASIPDGLMPRTVKDAFLEYLQRNWFHCEWSSNFTSEVLYNTELTERRNFLLFSENTTEQKFRDLDENVLGNHLNKSMTQFALLLIDKFLSSESKESILSHRAENVRTGRIVSIEKEFKIIERGFSLITQKLVLFGDINSPEMNGWVRIYKNKTNDVNFDNILPDEFFTDLYDMDKVDVYEKILENSSSPKKSLKEISELIIEDHPYDTVTNCKNLIKDLEMSASRILSAAVLDCLPDGVKYSFDPEQYYLCNTDMGVCTCYSFVIRGQPYLCNHLYAILSLKENVLEKNELIERAKCYIPTYNSIVSTSQMYKTNSTLNIIEQLKYISHLATETEIENAKKGSILKVLHDSWIPLSSVPGRPTARLPQYSGFRRDVNYPGNKNTSVTENSDEFFSDPYCPLVRFPENAKERHCGRKRSRPSYRGVKFTEVLYSVLKVLGIKIKRKKPSFPSVSYSSADSGDDFADITDKNISCSNNLPQILDEEKEPKLKKKRNVPVSEIMCSICIERKSCNIFSCSSLQELSNHIKRVHTQNIVTCGECFRKSGVSVTFNCERKMKEHFNLCHNVPPSDNQTPYQPSCVSNSDICTEKDAISTDTDMHADQSEKSSLINLIDFL